MLFANFGSGVVFNAIHYKQFGAMIFARELKLAGPPARHQHGVAGLDAPMHSTMRS